MEVIRLCPKLTDAHIYLNKMNKMKVKLMTQVFSRWWFDEASLQMGLVFFLLY
jgi:hypothetical protein